MNTGFTFLHVQLFVQKADIVQSDVVLAFHMALRGRTKSMEKLITKNDIQAIDFKIILA